MAIPHNDWPFEVRLEAGIYTFSVEPTSNGGKLSVHEIVEPTSDIDDRDMPAKTRIRLEIP